MKSFISLNSFQSPQEFLGVKSTNTVEAVTCSAKYLKGIKAGNMKDENKCTGIELGCCVRLSAACACASSQRLETVMY